MSQRPFACPSMVAALTGPTEVTIEAIILEYEWDIRSPLENLVRLKGALEFYDIECVPDLSEGDMNQPRVLRKKLQKDLAEIISQEVMEGESERTEFKSSLWLHRDKLRHNPGLPVAAYRSQEVLFGVLKTIAAFSNSKGGTLLVGIKDNGDILGIQDDYPLLSKPEQEFDGWELSLRGAIEANFVEGRAVNMYASIQKVSIAGKTVCRIQVAPRSRLSFVRSEKDNQRFELYVRSGNRSVPVAIEQIEGFFELRKRYV